MKLGKSTVEIPATFGANERKFMSNAVGTEGKQLVEIDLGGTADKIMFASAVNTALANGAFNFAPPKGVKVVTSFP